MYEFLSEEWIEAAREIRERVADDAPAFGVSVRINQVVTDVPINDREPILAYIDTSSGSFDIELGALDDPDVTVTTSYDLARSLITGQNPEALMQAFLEGRIKIQGDLSKLIALQGAVAQQSAVDSAASTFDELRSITS